MKLSKKLIAEAIGTFVLVFVACGVAALTGGSLVATSLAFGLVIVAMAHSIGRISGCHINPAVSFGCFLTKRMTGKEFIGYVCAQILGGFLGAVAVFGIAKMADLHLVGDACNSVVTGVVSAGTIFAALFVEIILTFIFVYVILNVTESGNPDSNKAGIVIGLTLTLVHLVGIGFTGTSVNPARSLATALGSLIFNGTTAAISQVWIFFVGPLVGAAVAALVFGLLHREK